MLSPLPCFLGFLFVLLLFAILLSLHLRGILFLVYFIFFSRDIILFPRPFIQCVYRFQYNARKYNLVGIAHIPYQNPGGSNQIVEQVISMTYTNIDAGITGSTDSPVCNNKVLSGFQHV